MIVHRSTVHLVDTLQSERDLGLVRLLLFRLLLFRLLLFRLL